MYLKSGIHKLRETSKFFNEGEGVKNLRNPVNVVQFMDAPNYFKMKIWVRCICLNNCLKGRFIHIVKFRDCKNLQITPPGVSGEGKRDFLSYLWFKSHVFCKNYYKIAKVVRFE